VALSGWKRKWDSFFHCLFFFLVSCSLITLHDGGVSSNEAPRYPHLQLTLSLGTSVRSTKH
jgi:hypothetical protein